MKINKKTFKDGFVTALVFLIIALAIVSFELAKKYSEGCRFASGHLTPEPKPDVPYEVVAADLSARTVLAIPRDSSFRSNTQGRVMLRLKDPALCRPGVWLISNRKGEESQILPFGQD